MRARKRNNFYCQQKLAVLSHKIISILKKKFFVTLVYFASDLYLLDELNELENKS